MNYLVVGNGAREHAICWGLSKTSKVFVLPGNPGMAKHAELIRGIPGDFDFVAQMAKKIGAKTVVVGPELPLVEGIQNVLKKKGVFVFGPSKEGARLEGSKSFAKDFMKRHKVPCASNVSFDNLKEALRFIQGRDYPLVIKVDGLAAGKGVHIVKNQLEGEAVINSIFSEEKKGGTGEIVVIEEFLVGKELTVMFVTDGLSFKMLPPSRDHKRLEDGDKGPMTGGMGSYCPVPDIDTEILDSIKKEIVEKTFVGMRKEALDYNGIVYCGLMLTKEGPKVLEYNCRLGDPEAQVVIPALSTPLSEIIEATKDGNLGKLPIVFKKIFSACVVLASKGYPVAPVIGKPIQGFEKAQELENSALFSAGIGGEPGRLVSAGGRVLSCVGFGKTLRQALSRAYKLTTIVGFEGMQIRGDIGGSYARGKTGINNIGLQVGPRNLRRSDKNS